MSMVAMTKSRLTAAPSTGCPAASVIWSVNWVWLSTAGLAGVVVSAMRQRPPGAGARWHPTHTSAAEIPSRTIVNPRPQRIRVTEMPLHTIMPLGPGALARVLRHQLPRFPHPPRHPDAIQVLQQRDGVLAAEP